jgi:hypothetical protein
LVDTTQKSRITFKTIFKPIIFRLKAYQHTCRFAVACNVDGLSSFCFVNQAGQGVFGFGDRYLGHTVASFWLFL